MPSHKWRRDEMIKCYLQEGQQRITVHLFHPRCLLIQSCLIAFTPLSRKWVHDECTMSCHYSLLSLLLYTHKVLYLNNLQVQLDRKLNCHYLSGWQEKKVTGGRSGFCPLGPPVVTARNTSRANMGKGSEWNSCDVWSNQCKAIKQS